MATEVRFLPEVQSDEDIRGVMPHTDCVMVYHFPAETNVATITITGVAATQIHIHGVWFQHTDAGPTDDVIELTEETTGVIWDEVVDFGGGRWLTFSPPLVSATDKNEVLAWDTAPTAQQGVAILYNVVSVA